MRARTMIPAQKPGVKAPSFSLRTQKPNLFQSTNSPVDHILSLQRTIGNQAVQRLIKSGALQAKLKIGQTPKLSHNLIKTQISALNARGQPLPESTRAFFEPRFGYDFKGVRVHTDSQAAYAVKTLNARAYTIGKDIIFNSGQYSMDTIQGKKLLAHELTHTIEQKKTFRTQKSAVPYLQMWRLGKSTEPLPHTDLEVVPSAHHSIVNRARDLIKKVVDNVKAYPGCRRYFEKKCGAGLNPNALKDAYNNAVIWYYKGATGTSFGGSKPGTHHLAYSKLAYRLGRWAIASTMIHEMFHRCDLATVNRELRAIEAEEKCRFYIPFIFGLNPKEGKRGDNVTINGTNFGDHQGRSDKVEFNGLNAGRASSWGMYSITVKVPARATTGPVVVTNNRVPSNKVNFVVKR